MAQVWQDSYLPAYYQDVHIFAKLADSFWIVMIVLFIVLEGVTYTL